jgi:hypothetical protein
MDALGRIGKTVEAHQVQHKARGADPTGKLGLPVASDFEGVERFKIAVGRGRKSDHARPNLAEAQLALPLALDDLVEQPPP